MARDSCWTPGARGVRGLSADPLGRRDGGRLWAGQVYALGAGRRRTFLLRLGLALTLAFVVLRWLNVYGDPVPWSPQATPFFTLLSFLNATKYPPSLLFLLMTLGPAMLFLRAVDGGVPRALRPALVFGRVPLFYFVLHFPLIHLLAVLTCLVRYGTAHWMFESPDLGNYPSPRRRAGDIRCRSST